MFSSGKVSINRGLLGGGNILLVLYYIQAVAVVVSAGVVDVGIFIWRVQSPKMFMFNVWWFCVPKI